MGDFFNAASPSLAKNFPLDFSSYMRIIPRMKTKSAFTLIELLVIIAIIGLLAAIMIPNFQKAKKMAEEKQRLEQSSEAIHIGDMVSLTLPNDVTINGRVNNSFGGYCSILISGTNGTPTLLENINVKLLKKQREWR